MPRGILSDMQSTRSPGLLTAGTLLACTAMQLQSLAGTAEHP